MSVFAKNDPRINRKGRPKGSVSLTTILKKKLAEVPKNQKITYADALIMALLDQAIIRKDPKAIKLVMAYTDGLPKGSLGSGFFVDLTLSIEERKKIKQSLLGDVVEK